ncbi:hypothetical protein [Candidatus Nitrosotenuis uzonensis]|uniref:Uncharacterized protein n=1 Tax=Candidatus Nitrosotenuis uzonensis TaxID=1407055 RepID=A0A812F0Y2_9ARCH|nr:hypothetical protein [Candidatus Nitrosotenuis uzonensis]CAE6486795.1 conserved hypothetical protein [Candidatus Nitrosotenuis uzonensis]
MGDIEKLKQLLNDHEKRISALEAALKGSSGKPRTATSGKKTITDLLIELKDAKFFNQPRPVNEIVKKLATTSYHYSGDSLTYPLQQAVRKGILGRIKQNGKWAWVTR